MDPLPALGLIGLLFIKEAGVPVPVPGDLLVIGAGIAAASGGGSVLLQLAAILAAGFAGGSLQFLIVRGTLRRRFLAALARAGVSPERLDRLADWLRRRGARGVAVARATPGLRIGAIAASGVAGLAYRGVFLPGLVVGNTLFVGAHFLLGFVIGPPAIAIVSGSAPTLLAAGLVALGVLGGAGWVLLRRTRRRASRDVAAGPGAASAVAAGDAAPPDTDLPGYGAWTEAACPACLAITVLARR